MKRWYQSKTMWLNIAMGVAVASGMLLEFLPMLEGAVPLVVYKWALFLTSIANVGLRKITSSAIG